PDAEGDEPREPGHGLTRYSKGGRTSWHRELDAAVKSMAASDDGKLAYVSTYDNKLSAIDARGRTLWSTSGMCKPLPLTQKRFLCYHDDDAEAGVAFDVYTDRGRKLLSYPITRDILALKLSADERNTVIALQGGQLILFGPDFHAQWLKRMPGGIADVA